MDWTAFLNDNAVEYATRGKNTARDHVSIRCPWCGDEDPSQHLGISLTSDAWGCLRNSRHRGHSPSHLIAAILGCSSHQARLIVSQYTESDPESLGVAQSPPEPKVEEIFDLRHERQIKPVGTTAKFWHYLEGRGFHDVNALIRKYRLTCCTTGYYKERIIIPLYKDKKLYAWTARAIGNPQNAPRYLSSELVKKTVFNRDIEGGELLFVVEGPFDALKLDYYGQEHGARATCTFGTSISIEQVIILNALKKLFQRVVVLFDRDALEPSFEAIDWLSAANVTLGTLPEKFKDPGEMSGTDIATFIQQVQHGGLP
jgi:hypothetical protein